MAGGWTKDGAVQQQMDASIDEGVARAKSQIPQGKSAQFCENCDAAIPEARRIAVPGVQMCINCQFEAEKHLDTQSPGQQR